MLPEQLQRQPNPMPYQLYAIPPAASLVERMANIRTEVQSYVKLLFVMELRSAEIFYRWPAPRPTDGRQPFGMCAEAASNPSCASTGGGGTLNALGQNFYPNACSSTGAGEGGDQPYFFVNGVLYNRCFAANGSATVPTAGHRLSPNAVEFVPRLVEQQQSPHQRPLRHDSGDEDEEGHYDPKDETEPPLHGICLLNPSYGVDNEMENKSGGYALKKKIKPPYKCAKEKIKQRKKNKIKSRSIKVGTCPIDFRNGSPRFKGAYTLLMKHRLANAEAYGIIQQQVPQSDSNEAANLASRENDNELTMNDNNSDIDEEGNVNEKDSNEQLGQIFIRSDATRKPKNEKQQSSVTESADELQKSTPRAAANQQQRQRRARSRGFTEIFGIYAPGTAKRGENVVTKNVLKLFSNRTSPKGTEIGSKLNEKSKADPPNDDNDNDIDLAKEWPLPMGKSKTQI